MSSLEIILNNDKDAPWGLISDEIPPRIIIWLSKAGKPIELSPDDLEESDLAKIFSAAARGILTINGEAEKSMPIFTKENLTPIFDSSTLSKPLSSGETLIVKRKVEEDKKRAEGFEKRVKVGYSNAEEILSLPAGKARKELKRRAQEGFPVTFFQNCKRKEEEKKDRKTVILNLNEIISTLVKAAVVDTVPNRDSGQTRLSNIYFDMIEEFEDEETED